MQTTRNSSFVTRYSPSVIRSAVSLLIVFCSLVLVPPPPVFAQGAKQETTQKTLESPYWRTNTLDFAKQVEQQGDATTVSQKRYSATQVMDTFNTIGYGILDPSGSNTRAAIPMLGRTIGLLSGNPPVETRQYFAYMAGKAGFVDQAYAANAPAGFGLLEPIQKIWVATRNIAYLIVSLILVVIGFMIMLRKKIDAQTVVGIQQALPNIVVTLLLITFSYAIAGFVIDMIYFTTFFGIKLLAINDVFTDNGDSAIELIRTKSLFTIGLANLFGGTHLDPENNSTPIETAADALGNLTANLLGDVTGGALSSVTGLIGQPIAFVIFAVAILFALFKLFFSLLMAYIQIILLAVLGPLQLMMNALPGSDAFSKWFRNLLANAIAFPAAALMIVFAVAIMGMEGDRWKVSPGIGFTDKDNGVNWTAPLIFGTGDNYGAGNAVDAVKALLGFGILLMTPKVVDMVKEALQAPEFKYGSAIGEAMQIGWQRTGGFASGYISNRQEEVERLRAGFYQQQGQAPSKDEMAELMKLGRVPSTPHGIAGDVILKQFGLRK